MEHLFVTVGASVLYAVAISVGYGRKLDESEVTRPLVVAGGVLIVLAGYTRLEWQQFSELFIFFTFAAIPQMLRVAILFVRRQDAAARKAHSVIHASERVVD